MKNNNLKFDSQINYFWLEMLFSKQRFYKQGKNRALIYFPQIINIIEEFLSFFCVLHHENNNLKFDSQINYFWLKMLFSKQRFYKQGKNRALIYFPQIINKNTKLLPKLPFSKIMTSKSEKLNVAGFQKLHFSKNMTSKSEK